MVGAVEKLAAERNLADEDRDRVVGREAALVEVVGAGRERL
jgi:hypothetical protein